MYIPNRVFLVNFVRLQLLEHSRFSIIIQDSCERSLLTSRKSSKPSLTGETAMQSCAKSEYFSMQNAKFADIQLWHGGTEARSLTDLGCRRSIGHLEEHGSCTRSCVGCPIRKDGEYTFNTWIRTRILSTEHDFGESMRSILQSAWKQKQSREQKQRQRERQHEAIGNSSPGWLPLFGP